MVEFDGSVQVLKMVIQLPLQRFHTRSKKINEAVSDADDSVAKYIMAEIYIRIVRF